MRSNRLLILTVAVCFVLGFTVTPAALASSYGTGFESFIIGDLNGQDGWTSGHGSSFCPLYDVGVVDNLYGYMSFGGKSLRISNAITCGSYNDQTFSPSLADEAGEVSASTSTYSGGIRQPYFEAQWDFASIVPGSEQPGLSVVASPDRGDPMRMSWVQMADTPTGLQLNFEDYQHSLLNFVLTPIATSLDRTVSHTVKLTMQYIAGAENDVVRVYLDGVLIHTGTSWEDYYRDFAGGIPHPVDSMMFREAGTAAPINLGKGFLIDNFTALSSAVPAPTPPSAPIVPPASPHFGTINVVNTVVNDNGGTKTVADFELFVNGTTQVISGETHTFPAPSVAYTITENIDPNYTQSFSGDCDSGGRIGLNPGANAFCIITNNDIGAPTVVPPVPPLIDVVKVPTPSALPNGPGPVLYTYTLRNIGTVPVSNITMVGDTCDPIIVKSGDTNSDGSLDVNETWVYTCKSFLSITTTNTVLAEGDANGLTARDLAIVTVVVSLTPMFPNTGSLQPVSLLRVDTPLLNVRKSPSLSSVIVGQASQGLLGAPMGDTVTHDGYVWVNVAFQNGLTGWSAKVGFFWATPGSTESVRPRFVTGDRVRIIREMNVRKGAGTSALILRSQPSGSLGVLLGGPITQNNFIWWQIKYDGDITGWTAETGLTKL